MSTSRGHSKLAFAATAFFTLTTSIFTPLSAQTPLFYGMTSAGGSNNDGAIISFNPSGNAENVVWNFGNGSDGKSPWGNLVYDPGNGLFYGMTSGGGSNTLGAIISFNPTTNKDSVVWSFGGTDDGQEPLGSLVYNPQNGLFYGMTYIGGSNAIGTIISFNPATNKEKVVYNFGNGISTDGAVPFGNDLVYDAGNGLFYGMTTEGGTGNLFGFTAGTIISFNPATNKDSMVWNFAGPPNDGGDPEGNLVYDAGTGLFYGMVARGGNNDASSGGGGIIISFNPVKNKENVVWNFGNGKDGKVPYGSLVNDANTGLFYGMTNEGGSKDTIDSGGGTIISFNPAGNAENVLWNFGGSNDGKHPNGDLIYDANNGLFYGMTQAGGTNGTGDKDGTIFSFNPSTGKDSVVWNLGSGTDGFQPYGNLVLYPSVTGIKAVGNPSAFVRILPDPNNGNFTIQLQNAKQNNQLELFNVLGEKVYELKLLSNTVQINLGDHAAGIYSYRVLDQQRNTIGEGKFIVE